VSQPKRFDPFLALEALNRHRVRYVLIGSLAGAVHGSPTAQAVLEICPDRKPDNGRRLQSALDELHARPRGPKDVDPDMWLVAGRVALRTDCGPLDVVASPPGTYGYQMLDARAELFDFEGVEARVASLADLIEIKRAGTAPIDRMELELLGALRDAQRQQPA
jgi:hypothetical protein